jgi:hypothetical protein
MRVKPLRCEIEAYWSGKYSWDSFCGMLDYGKDNYAQWKASGWPDIHVQELQAVSHALASADQKPNGQRQAREPMGTKESGTDAKTVTIQNSTVIIGDKNVIEEHSSGGRETPIGKKNEKNPKKTIAAIVAFLAQLWTCSGWLRPIKAFFHWLRF